MAGLVLPAPGLLGLALTAVGSPPLPLPKAPPDVVVVRGWLPSDEDELVDDCLPPLEKVPDW